MQQPIGNLRAQVRAALGYRAESVQEIVVGSFFQYKGAGTRANGADHGMLVIVHGKNDDLRLGAMAQDFGGGFDAVQTGQADVHQDDVWPFLAAHLYGFGAVFGLAKHHELITVTQDGLNAVSHDFVIVNQEHLRRHWLRPALESRRRQRKTGTNEAALAGTPLNYECHMAL